MRPSIVVSRGGAAPRRERGVVLFVALIVLIIMTLAGLALLRQMTTGVSIAGNIAFKENATSVADRGAEVAMQYLALPTTVLRWIRFPTATSRAGPAPSPIWLTRPIRPCSTGPSRCCWCHPTRRRPAIPHESSSIACACSPTRGSMRPARRCSDAPILNSGASTGGGGYPGGVLPPVTPTPFYRITTQVLRAAQHGQLHAGSPAVTASRAEKEKP